MGLHTWYQGTTQQGAFNEPSDTKVKVKFHPKCVKKYRLHTCTLYQGITPQGTSENW